MTEWEHRNDTRKEAQHMILIWIFAPGRLHVEHQRVSRSLSPIGSRTDRPSSLWNSRVSHSGEHVRIKTRMQSDVRLGKRQHRKLPLRASNDAPWLHQHHLTGQYCSAARRRLCSWVSCMTQLLDRSQAKLDQIIETTVFWLWSSFTPTVYIKDETSAQTNIYGFILHKPRRDTSTLMYLGPVWFTI